jgi:hypothetical protein
VYEQYVRYGLSETARFGVNPKEGALGRVCYGLKQAVMLRVLARRRSRGLHRKVKNARTGERGRMELLRKRRPATEGVRGHVVLVRLSQPRGAEGQRPM